MNGMQQVYKKVGHLTGVYFVLSDNKELKTVATDQPASQKWHTG